MRTYTILFLIISTGLIASIIGYLDYKSLGNMCPQTIELINCRNVYIIPEARVLGLHLSELAPLYFTTLLATLTLYKLTNTRILLQTNILLSITGFTLTPYLIDLELGVAKALCIYCTIMHISIIGLTITYIYTYKELISKQ
ncbi:MAG: vitamin K epoxide reductase family protein [Acidilobaceae archaeon]